MQKGFRLLLLAASLTSTSTLFGLSDVTYVLNQTNDPGNFGSEPGNFGTVRLQLVSSSIKLTVNLANQWTVHQQGFGFNSSFAIDPTISATGITPASVPSANPAFSLYNSGAPMASTNWDGFGNFDYGLMFNGQNKDGPNNFSFTVSTANGFTDVLELVSNSRGNNSNPPGEGYAFFAVHAINNGQSGHLAANGVTTVPEPSTYGFLAISALAIVARYRRRRSAE
jgi:hypothetical protein